MYDEKRGMPYSFGYMFYCWTCHFLLSATAGLLTYWLVSKLLMRFACFKENVGLIPTHHFSIIIALCVAVIIHVVQDYTLGWF